MAEREIKLNLENLIQRQDRLSRIVEQRESLADKLAIPEGVKPSLRQAFGLTVRTRVLESINRLQSEILSTQEELDKNLPGIANTYVRELRRQTRFFEKVLRAKENGSINLPDKVFSGYKKDLEELSVKPEKDKLLARALGINPPKEIQSKDDGKNLDNTKEAISEEETGVNPFVEPSGSSRSGTREKQMINMPDGTTLEVFGKRGKGIKFIVSNGEFSVSDFTTGIYGSGDKTTIEASKALLRDIKSYLSNLGWEINIPTDLKNIGEIKTFSIKKAQTEPQAPNPNQTEIDKLQADISELRATLISMESEPILAKRIQKGLQDKKRALKALKDNQQTPSPEEENLNLSLLKKYDNSYEHNLTVLLLDIQVKKGKNEEQWTYARIYQVYKIDYQYIRGILQKGLFDRLIRNIRKLTFDSATLATIRYIYQHRKDIRSEADRPLALEVKTAAQKIAEKLQTPVKQ